MLNGVGKAWLPVYAQMPLTAVSGHGSWLVDEHGDEWLDLGIDVVGARLASVYTTCVGAGA